MNEYMVNLLIECYIILNNFLKMNRYFKINK